MEGTPRTTRGDGPAPPAAAQPTRARAVAWWVAAHAGLAWPILLLGGLAVLSWEAIHTVDAAALRIALRDMDRRWLTAAFALTVLNLVVMGAYDVIAFRDAAVPARRRWLYGVLAYGWSNFLTVGPVAGPAIRFWLYPSSAARSGVLARGVAQVAVGFGGALVAWVSAALVADLLPARLMLPVLLIGVPLAALGLAAVTRSLQRALWERFAWARMPARWERVLLVGLLDWGLAAAVFLAVLRAAGVPADGRDVIWFFLGQAIGLVSLVPGGLGTADAFWLGRLPGPSGTVAAALLAYRGIYYLLPWAGASLALLRIAAGRGAAWLPVTRAVLASLLAAAGGLLLLSAAAPVLFLRLRTLERIMPLPVLELSHLSATLLGALLLVVARGLAKGYRAAHRIGVAGALAGALTCLLKGLDIEEALLLAGVAVLLVAQAPFFRQPSRGDSFGWRGLGLLILGVFVFVTFGLATHDADALTKTAVSTFHHHAEAARFLRGAAVLGLATTVATVWVVLRTPVGFSPPTRDEIAGALAVHARYGRHAIPLMVANGDKAIWARPESGMCTYRVIGPYLVAYSDPSVRAGAAEEFLDGLLGFAREIDRRVLFYQISTEWIPPLHDRGYHFFKLGEEAHVDLAAFTIAGAANKGLRGSVRHVERAGVAFSVVPAAEVPPLLPELRRVSDTWLAAKGAREKQFSVGHFDEAYLATFPCALVRSTAGAIVAFANLLPGPERVELSIDLMRHGPDAPAGTMDFLFVHLFAWGRGEGYRWFNLGMAPLATVGVARGARGSERLAHLFSLHGQHWYNFQGLRQYKEKFHPHWVPRYLAYPDVWELPRAMADVSALIAGGWGAVLGGNG